MLGVVVVGIVTGLALLVRTWPPPPPTFGFTGFTALVAAAFAGMGTLLVARRPGNVVGWLLLAEGVLSAIQFGLDTAPTVAATVWPSDPGRIAWMSWLSNVVWVPSVAVFGPLFLLFPDGRPVSPRWRALGPANALGAAILILGLATLPGPLANFQDISNPVTIGGDWSDVAIALGAALFLGASALSAVSLVVRWRRSTGDARQQLKWLASVSVPFVVAGAVSPTVVVAQYVMIGFGLAAPVAIAIAVLRYRLYDIDEILSRTFVYGALTAILAGVYAASLKVLQEVFVQLTGAGSDGAVIASTLVTAAFFAPVRRGLDSVVERRFKRPSSAPPPTGPAMRVEAAVPVGLGDVESVVRRVIREELAAAGFEGAGATGGPATAPVEPGPG
jgi:hypothetical protein